MKSVLLTLFITTTILVACNKEDITSNVKPAVPKEFEKCDCQVTPDKDQEGEYIKAEINGVSVCFDQKPAMDDIFSNVFRYGSVIRDTGNQYYDNLTMIRDAHNSQWQAALFFENTHALTKTYPYTLPRPNPEVCEIGELQLNNRSHYTSCTFCPANVYNFYASIWGDGVKMIATSFNGNVFEGIFSGVAVTGSGRSVTITNGKFRIRLFLQHENIVVH